ncbi:MAG: ferritin family protein [Mobilitalea sp.]
MKTLDFAINMEQEGYKYYAEQAEFNKDNELQKVFQVLSKSEKEHAALLQKRKKQEAFDLNAKFELPEIKNVFKSLKNFRKEHTTKQLDVYKLASSQEEKSIDLYNDMLSKSSDDKDKELFTFLIKQEKEHLILFEELVAMLMRPEEWVENAEFGEREEY